MRLSWFTVLALCAMGVHAETSPPPWGGYGYPGYPPPWMPPGYPPYPFPSPTPKPLFSFPGLGGSSSGYQSQSKSMMQAISENAREMADKNEQIAENFLEQSENQNKQLMELAKWSKVDESAISQQVKELTEFYKEMMNSQKSADKNAASPADAVINSIETASKKETETLKIQQGLVPMANPTEPEIQSSENQTSPQVFSRANGSPLGKAMNAKSDTPKNRHLNSLQKR